MFRSKFERDTAAAIEKEREERERPEREERERSDAMARNARKTWEKEHKIKMEQEEKERLRRKEREEKERMERKEREEKEARDQKKKVEREHLESSYDDAVDKISGEYRIVTDSEISKSWAGVSFFRSLADSLEEGFVPIGGLTIDRDTAGEDASGDVEYHQVMYRPTKSKLKESGMSDSTKYAHIDPDLTPINVVPPVILSGGKRNKRKSKKYISKRKNKTGKRH